MTRAEALALLAMYMPGVEIPVFKNVNKLVEYLEEEVAKRGDEIVICNKTFAWVILSKDKKTELARVA